jgi:predicted porin
MKKSLFALAAVTAFAGAAQAQSSVTVYGILDVGFISGSERIAGVNNVVAGLGSQVYNQNFSTLGASAQSTSRLGFRGREDLGGGTAAFFTLEMEVTPNSATSPVGTGNNNRAAFVGLSQKGIGQGSIGLQNTVVTDAIGPTITGQFNNIVGSMLFPGGIASRSTASADAGALASNRANGNNDGFTFRTTNTLKVQSERMAGFQAGAMYVHAGRTQDQVQNTGANLGYVGGKDDQTGWGLGLNYTYKKAIVTAAYQSLSATDPYTATAAQVALGGVGAAAGAPAAFGATTSSSAGTAGVNVKDNQAYVGATYDFGILKAYASWLDRKITSQINSNTYAKRTAQEIGVRGNWTPKIESWASMGNGRVQTFGNGQPTANIVGWQLGSNYILSKRTNLYAIYGQTGTSNVSSVANANPISYNNSQYALGVRHTF